MGQINLIDKDSDISKRTKYGWDVDINGRLYDVYRIEGFIHTIGGEYGENNLWACPRGEEPTYENLIEFSGYSVRWGIEVQENNYVRSKWDEAEVRKSCKCLITRNGKPFYAIAAGSLDFALTMARSTLYEIQEHPLNFFEQDFGKYITGRKIYWREQPAIIKRYNIDSDGDFRLIIAAESPNGFNPPCYLDKDEEMEDEDRYTIVDDVLSKSIYWFRE
ncbi:hypothetical protein [Cohnella massiliensis]|uniref:hypothetical protein n=1 Tax=Cohnella massiliensis TaxID=1816691 RepID=UPI0009BC642C|nr:hypothetical protein [Cohnella massiliensis]